MSRARRAPAIGAHCREVVQRHRAHRLGGHGRRADAARGEGDARPIVICAARGGGVARVPPADLVRRYGSLVLLAFRADCVVWHIVASLDSRRRARISALAS